MVSTAVLGVPSVAPPVGFDSARFTVSFGSSKASLRIRTVNVLLVSLALNVSVPAVTR
jgi:hypothetical protein